MPPAGMWPRSRESRPFLLASPSGLGSIVFTDIPSTQPVSSTSVAFFRSECAVMWNRELKRRPLRSRAGE